VWAGGDATEGTKGVLLMAAIPAGQPGMARVDISPIGFEKQQTITSCPKSQAPAGRAGRSEAFWRWGMAAGALGHGSSSSPPCGEEEKGPASFLNG